MSQKGEYETWTLLKGKVNDEEGGGKEMIKKIKDEVRS